MCQKIELLDFGMVRYTPSQADVAVFKAISPSSINPNVARWYSHIQSYTAEHESLPGSSTAGEAFISSGDAVPAAAPAPEEEEEVDLFGSNEEDDAEAERIKAQRIEEYNKKKAGKPKAAAKV
jgi:elongation factor 1-beta